MRRKDIGQKLLSRVFGIKEPEPEKPEPEKGKKDIRKKKKQLFAKLFRTKRPEPEAKTPPTPTTINVQQKYIKTLYNSVLFEPTQSDPLNASQLKQTPIAKPACQDIPDEPPPAHPSSPDDAKQEAIAPPSTPVSISESPSDTPILPTERRVSQKTLMRGLGYVMLTPIIADNFVSRAALFASIAFLVTSVEINFIVATVYAIASIALSPLGVGLMLIGIGLMLGVSERLVDQCKKLYQTYSPDQSPEENPDQVNNSPLSFFQEKPSTPVAPPHTELTNSTQRQLQ